jgi:hypothetical protein
VGETISGTTDKSLALHFTGGKWTQVKVPHFGNNDALAGVAATSAKDVWAVGATFAEPLVPASGLRGLGRAALGRRPLATAATEIIQTVILRWNGKTWAHVPSPSPNNEAALNTVGVSSPANALAAGFYFRADGTLRTLAERWNGKTWTRTATPNPGSATAFDELTGVTVISQDNAWAVGLSDGSPHGQSIIQHWDGSHWTSVTAPDPGTSTELLGIAASSASNIWAVGDVDVSSTAGNQALTLRCC